MKRQTNLVIISGPSGSGKDSVIDGLIKKGILIERVITSTTRPARSMESNGNPYYFINEKEFKQNIEKNIFVEWAKVDNGKFYGVTKTEIDRVQKIKNKIGIWKIEYKGLIAAKKIFPDILSILIEPPDIESLVERSRKRAQQKEKEIQERVLYSKEFMKHKNLYDYSIINEHGKLDKTIDSVILILNKEGYIDNFLK
jgi:guanylate kinase